MQGSTYSKTLALMDEKLKEELREARKEVEAEEIIKQAINRSKDAWLKHPETIAFLTYLEAQSTNLMFLAKQASANCINGGTSQAYVLPFVFEAQVLDKVLNYAKINKYE